MIDLQTLKKWIREDNEDENLEFKRAKNQYSFEKLADYCIALANEGGGYFILGVSDEKPREIEGTQAFRNLNEAKIKLLDILHLRIEAEEMEVNSKRIVVFSIPSRPMGTPLHREGRYLMRVGESLVSMSPDQLSRILAEAEPDFSARICEGASIKDLETPLISIFQKAWYEKEKKDYILKASPEKLLHHAELMVDGKVTYAALILFGTHRILGRELAQAETVFEYRSKESDIPFSQREEFRIGFFAYFDRLWSLINLRNDKQHFQEGLFIWDIPTFHEEVMREAILNAVSHRDYRLGGSIFIRQFPQKIEIISPGGFPPGITTSNLLYRQNPRNRRIAEAFLRCGLVERSGQGFDKIISTCIQESKSLPDFENTDNFQVSLTFHGQIQDSNFLLFLRKLKKELALNFSVEDLLIMDSVHQTSKIPSELKKWVPNLLENGVIEKTGRTSGMKYILSKRFYDFKNDRGKYTRIKGLDREQKKALLLQHLKNYGKGTFAEFQEVLPNTNRTEIKSLLRDLKKMGKIEFIGQTRGGFWKLKGTNL